ncbi:MAG TPA: MaoC/PaaZ C-terminal domain-containing protein [Acidimicrobiales bacterium]|nr:MaoC/PaaZ C-terminal domain-containing protein [Acidimicrobiales bacterium]
MAGETGEARARGLAVGDEIPPFVRTTGFAHWNRYAAVNDEFVPIHMDDGAGREAGYPSAIGMGNLQWAFLHNVLREWMGEDGRIEQVACQFRSPNLRDQTVSARGRIEAIRPDGDRVVVELTVWTEVDGGDPLAPGTATVSLPAAGPQ